MLLHNCGIFFPDKLYCVDRNNTMKVSDFTVTLAALEQVVMLCHCKIKLSELFSGHMLSRISVIKYLDDLKVN